MRQAWGVNKTSVRVFQPSRSVPKSPQSTLPPITSPPPTSWSNPTLFSIQGGTIENINGFYTRENLPLVGSYIKATLKFIASNYGVPLGLISFWIVLPYVEGTPKIRSTIFQGNVPLLIGSFQEAGLSQTYPGSPMVNAFKVEFRTTPTVSRPPSEDITITFIYDP